MLKFCVPPISSFFRIIGLYLCFFLPFSANAQQADSNEAFYKVSNIDVDVTAANAAKARDQAILQAQRAGLVQLVGRLGGAEKIATTLSDDDVALLVKAFEVQKETTSAVRYIASFSVQYKPLGIKNLMDRNGVAYTEERSAPVLVLPVVIEGKRKILWEEQTAWRSAWSAASLDEGRVSYKLPEGDVDDIAIISGEEAVSGSVSPLSRIAGKYGAGKVLVAAVHINAEKATTAPVTSVELVVYDQSGNKLNNQPTQPSLNNSSKAGGAANSENFATPAKNPDNSVEALKQTNAEDAEALGDDQFDLLVRKTQDAMAGAWSNGASIVAGPAMSLKASVVVSSLNEWLNMRKKLGEIAIIKHIAVLSLARNAVSITLDFRAEISELQEAVRQAGLNLVNENGLWVLKQD